MISVNKANIKVNGDLATIRAEYAFLTRNLLDIYTEKFGKEQAKKMIADGVADAHKTVDELKEEVAKLAEEVGVFTEDFGKLIKKLLEEKNNG